METKEETQGCLELLHKIEHMVRRFLHEAASIDPENIATDIWVDTWVRKVPVSWRHVRHRCIDAIRTATRHGEVELRGDYEAPVELEGSPESEDARERLDKLMKCPWITNKERGLLYQRYYAGMTDGTIASMQVPGCSREKITKDIAQALEKLRLWAFVQEQEGKGDQR